MDYQKRLLFVWMDHKKADDICLLMAVYAALGCVIAHNVAKYGQVF